MPNNHFVTGMPKSGKTTLLTKLVAKMKAQGLRVGGFLSPQVKTHGTRTGFVVQDIESGRTEILASVDIDGPKVAKYHVDIKSFENLALPVLRNALRYDVIVIDEIGRMEMKSTKFGEVLADIFESEIPIIATLHRDYIEDFQAWGDVLMLTPSSRERIYADMIEKVAEIKAKKESKKQESRAKSKAKENSKVNKVKLGKKKKTQVITNKKTKSKNKKAIRSKQSDKRKAWLSAAKDKAKKRKTSSKSAHEDFDKIADDIHKHHRQKGESIWRGQHINPESEPSESENSRQETEHPTQETRHKASDTEHSSQDTNPETPDSEPEHHKRGWRKWVKEHVGV